MRLASQLIHPPGGTCEHTGAVHVPVYESSTFKQDAPGRNKGYDYSRTGNPTRDALEAAVAQVESGRHGVAFSSGMAAITACLMLLRTGDHVVATAGLYGGTYRLLTRVIEDFGVRTSFVDTGDLGAVEAAFAPETKALLVETPSNPLMRISDIRALAELAHARGAWLMVDNTFMSPWLQRPLELGADVVIESATKFLNGHSDVIAGLASTNDDALAKRLKLVQNAVGAVPSPFECWLLLRGMKTLAVRLSHEETAAGMIAEWLSGRPEVDRVLYPGLETLDGYKVHRAQADGPGAVLSFVLTDGLDADAFVSSTTVWTLAVSLGAVESIITLPSKMTHVTYPRQALARLGIGDNLVRLSVGLEDANDLIADLEAAFSAAQKAG